MLIGYLDIKCRIVVIVLLTRRTMFFQTSLVCINNNQVNSIDLTKS